MTAQEAADRIRNALESPTRPSFDFPIEANPSALRALLAERDELRESVSRWISPKDELPPTGISVPTLTPEKRSTTGWAHSYASWTDDDDDNSRYDAKMFRDRVHFWCKLPALPISPKQARALNKD